MTCLTLNSEFEKNYDIPLGVKYLQLNCNNSYIIDSLPNSIIELELGYTFNLEMNNLPTSIKKLVICKYSDYNMDLNCLPDFVEELQLNDSYKKRILNIPSNLKKLICDKNYKYKDDFAMCIVQTCEE